MIRTVVALTAVCLVIGGCNSPDSRLNAPPHGRVYETNDLQGTYTYMIDNAALADMTVNDTHFLPHRPLLNDLGVQRLARLAELMDAYGGTIRFDTDLTDDELIDQRMKEIVSFLSESGIDTTSQVVMRDLPGGEGSAATEAILIKAKEGTYDPKKKQSESRGAAGAMAK
jgi:hypothetical protein